ncbi:MAG: hypothetical protein V8S58_16795 [Lachnospiraceae bacterium]
MGCLADGNSAGKHAKRKKQREQEREMQMPWDLMFVGETQSGYGASAGHLDEDDRIGGMTSFSGARHRCHFCSRAAVLYF